MKHYDIKGEEIDESDCYCEECMNAMNNSFGIISATVQNYYEIETEE